MSRIAATVPGIKLVLLITALFLVSSAVPAAAAIVSIISPSQLAPEGKVFWGDFGDGGTPVPAGSVATIKSLVDQSALASMTIGSGAPNYNGPFVVYNVTAPEGKGAWEIGSNFTPGDRVLLANSGAFGEPQRFNRPWEFTFSQPVSGFGAQGNTTTFGGGGMSITAYDASDNVLGHFSIAIPGPHTNPNADGTAPFLGVLSNAANISRIEFDVLGGSGDNALNSPFVRFAPDPNAVTLLLGDFNRNGILENADLQAMLGALKNLTLYKQNNYLIDDDLRAIGDLNRSGQVDAGDIPPMLELLTGNYSPPFQNVPEPTALSLAVATALLLATQRQRFRG